MKKPIFYTELAYLLGILFLALGASLMTRADFGLSMVIAPAYLLHLKISGILPFFSFGMAEYTLQAILLLAMIIILRKFKITYLFSFATAVLYGFALDAFLMITTFIPYNLLPVRIILFVIGLIATSLGVSLIFHTYISPEVYELFVKELSEKFKIDLYKVKTAYDCASCAIAIIMSFAFFGLWQFEGVKFGTIICALINGFLIGKISLLLEKIWDFKDKFSLRKYF